MAVRHVVALRAGPLKVALLADHVEAVGRALPIEPVLGLGPGVLGVSVVRGEVTPVIDLRTVAGVPDDAPAQRFVAVRAGSRRVALAVDAVDGVRTLRDEDLALLPPLLHGAAAEPVAHIATVDRALYQVLHAAWIADVAQEPKK